MMTISKAHARTGHRAVRDFRFSVPETPLLLAAAA
jgi:hypothetical protein